MDLFRWIQEPKNQKAYQEWLDNPITQTMLNGFKLLATHRRLGDDVTGERALQEVGFFAGRDSMIESAGSLLDFVVQPGIDSNVNRIKYLVEVEHYTPEEAKRMVEEAQQ